MGVVDTVILFSYLALLIGIGLYARRGKPDVDDYFVAGRRMGPVTIACMWVAAWIGGASIVGTSARVYAQGITGIWYVLGIAIGCCLFGLTVARRVKQLGDSDRHLTYPDFIEAMAIPHKTALYTELRKVVDLPAVRESAAQGAARGRRGRRTVST